MKLYVKYVKKLDFLLIPHYNNVIGRPKSATIFGRFGVVKRGVKMYDDKKRIYLFQCALETSKNDITEIVRWLDSIECDYLITLHNKDNSREPHYHINAKLKNARTFDDIARQLNCPSNLIQHTRNFKRSLEYAFHLNEPDKSNEKYVYDKSALIASHNIDIDKIFSDNITEKSKKQHIEKIKKLLYDYGDLRINKQDLISQLNSQDFDLISTQFERMRKFRQLKVKERQMEVVYITGSGGSGKTTLAKYIAKSKNFDFFVSGSGKDILDGYDKEECIILDDFRSDNFKKDELFKLTDNNTNSSVKSRYNNKDISMCKLMIITSIVPPHELYDWREDKEPFNQFSRRIRFTYIQIYNEGSIYELRYRDNFRFDKPITEQIVIKPTPLKMDLIFHALGILNQLSKNTLTSIFNDIETQIKLDERNKEKNITIDDLLNESNDTRK